MDQAINHTNTEEIPPEESWQQVIFHGDGKSYFSIWILNLVLTLLTLGIYSAWATVRDRRYIYGNVEVAGGRFDFHGRPLQILIGRIIAIVLLIAWTQGHYIHFSVQLIAIGIVLVLFPWFLVRAMSFRLRNTSLRNLRFNFCADTRSAYVLFGKYLLIAGLSVAVMYWSLFSAFGTLDPETMQQEPDSQMAMGPVIQLMVTYLFFMIGFCFLYPAFVCDIRRFSVNNTEYGDHPFAAKLFKADFIGYFWAAIGIAVGTTIVVGIAMSVLLGLTAYLQAGNESKSIALIMIIVVAGYVIMGLCYLLGYAFWQVRTTNKIFSVLQLEHVRFRSNLEVWPLSKILLGNTLMLIMTLGFAYPWTRIRLMRYKLQAVEYMGDADQFSGSRVSDVGALGDEVGDSFDLDFGFGF